MSKTSQGLVSYCRAQLGRPYWWGCFGQCADAALLAAKRQQYPSQYKAQDFPRQYGHKVHDCSGLIKGYLWSDGPDEPARYNRHQDTNVEGLYHHCTNHGNLASLPEVPGTLLFRSDMGHVGVYVGSGKVIEARGHAYGVCETEPRHGSWAKWGQLDWLDYGTQPEPAKPAPAPNPAPDPEPQPPAPEQTVRLTVELPVLRRGDSGKTVKLLQHLLLAHGCSLGRWGSDGQFGPTTAQATRDFQRRNSLRADAIVGADTWTALLHL